MEADAMAEGVALFNSGKHWHAHEAWEHLWLELEGDEKRFVQGLIMGAALLVQYSKGIRQGVLNHHRNVMARLPGNPGNTWGLDVTGLLDQLAPFAQDAEAGNALHRETKSVQLSFK